MTPSPIGAWAERLARRLLAMPSTVGTPEEAHLGHWLHRWLARLPYFRRHPERLQAIPTPGPHAPPALVAWLAGPPGREAVLLLGHYDTGPPPPPAEVPPAGTAWLAGPGAGVKSGVAVLLALCRLLGELPGGPPGHAVLLLTPDHRGRSRGTLAALPALAELVDRHGLRFAGAVAVLPTGPRHPGDPHRWLYLGGSGRLVLAFHVRGRPVPPGVALAGPDPAFLAAALVRRLAHEPDPTEVPPAPALPGLPAAPRDWLPPPTPLPSSAGVTDAEVRLRVATAAQSPAATVARLQEAARHAVRDALHLLLARHDRLARLAGLPRPEGSPHVPVQTLGELAEEVRRRGGRALAGWQEAARRLEAADAVRALLALAGGAEPRVILFGEPPCLPRVAWDPAAPSGARVVRALAAALVGIRRDPSWPALQVGRFAPDPGDLGLLCPSPDDPDWDRLAGLFPAGLPDRAAATRLGAPGIVLGPHALDVDLPTERVDRRDGFRWLPRVLYRLLLHLWGAAPPAPAGPDRG